MQIIKQLYHDMKPSYPIEQFAPVDKILFMDIETTGFSPKSSSLYMIGCAFYEKDGLYTVQWLADAKKEEAEILENFFSFSMRFTCLIHYNGNQFDLPYLFNKAKQFLFGNPLKELTRIDIYQLIRPLKKLLSLTSMRQKSIEEFMHISRNDQYDGGQLISVYKEYEKTKDGDLLSVLLMHNKEDLIGMTKLLPIFNYLDLIVSPLNFTAENFHPYEDYNGSKQTELLLSYSCPVNIPSPFSTYREHLFLSCDRNSRLTFRLPLYNGELKHFYKNYKDYYYLPEEDCCIHKSAAMAVDKDHRLHAKKETCYTKHTGLFLPQFSSIITPYFQTEYKTKILYFEYNRDNMTPAAMNQYGTHLLNFFCG